MVHKSVLTNGIRVVSERIPSRTVSVGFWIDAGSRDETPAESGCAHFVEHMLFKGTASRSNEDIARQLDRLGGMSNAFTTRENTCLYATVLDDQLGELLSLFAEMLTHSRFAAAEVERERQVILQEIGMVEDSPEDLSHDLFLANLWGDHPLGRTILGQREAVASMTARRLKGFCRRMHVPANLLVAAAGQVDHAALVRLVETALAVSLPEPPAKAGGVPRIAPRARSGVALHPRRFEQTHVILGVEGLPVRSPDRYALNLLNILLGGNMSSRLFQEVREKRGLAYNIYSFVESEGDSGLVGLYTAVAPAALGQALEVIREVVGRMCEREVPGQEWDNAQKYARASMYLAAESMDARMLRLARNELAFGRHVPFAEVEEAMRSVRPSEVTALAARLLRAPLASVLLGPTPARIRDKARAILQTWLGPA